MKIIKTEAMANLRSLLEKNKYRGVFPMDLNYEDERDFIESLTTDKISFAIIEEFDYGEYSDYLVSLYGDKSDILKGKLESSDAVSKGPRYYTTTYKKDDNVYRILRYSKYVAYPLLEFSKQNPLLVKNQECAKTIFGEFLPKDFDQRMSLANSVCNKNDILNFIKRDFAFTCNDKRYVPRPGGDGVDTQTIYVIRELFYEGHEYVEEKDLIKKYRGNSTVNQKRILEKIIDYINKCLREIAPCFGKKFKFICCDGKRAYINPELKVKLKLNIVA